MEKGNFLRFVPPVLQGEEIGKKERYMLIVESDENNKVLKMINVSSTKGKEHKLLFDSNIEINYYYPLPAPSFAKLDTLYIIDDFKKLENYIAFGKQKIGDLQLQYINQQRLKYMKDKEIDIIQYTEDEFNRFNK